MIIIYQCAFCRHFDGSHIIDDATMPDGWRLLDQCVAFPDGIPAEILEGRVDHRRAYPGDNGIGFAPKDADADRLQALCFALPVVTPGGAGSPLTKPNPS